MGKISPPPPPPLFSTILKTQLPFIKGHFYEQLRIDNIYNTIEACLLEECLFKLL